MVEDYTLKLFSSGGLIWKRKCLSGVSSVVPRLQPGHFKRSCGRGKAPPPCSPFLQNGARGSPTHSCGSDTGLPPVTQKKNQEGQKAEAGNQRASEPPLFTHLRLARASMKIWCFRKRDTAIKWRALLVAEESSLLACVVHKIFGNTSGPLFH